MTDIKVCEIDPELKAAVKKLRYGKKGGSGGTAAVIMKIDMESMMVTVDDQLEGCSVEDLAGELPEFSPRYIALSYSFTHDDGRVSYPFLFIHYSPPGVKPEHNMIYAGTKTAVVNAVEISKVFEVRSADELTEEWLKQKMGFFG